MSGFDTDRLDPRPVLFEIFAQQVLLLVVEVSQEQREKITGAVLKYRLMRGIERCDHRFEQMHVRILPSRHRGRQTFQEAAMRRAQLRVQEMTEHVDFGSDLRIPIECIDAGEGQQHEGVVIGIAQRLQHGALRRQDVDKTRPAIGSLGLAQEVIEALQRDLAAVGIPAQLGRLGVAIDLPGLHQKSASAPVGRRIHPDRAGR